MSPLRVETRSLDGSANRIRLDATGDTPSPKAAQHLGLRGPKIGAVNQRHSLQQVKNALNPPDDGPARERHSGNEARFLLYIKHPSANILGQVCELRDGVAADGRRGHAYESTSEKQTIPGHGA